MKNTSLLGRFEKRALFLSASALCLGIASPAAAGPLDNTPFFSMYGGYAFSEANNTVDFVSDDDLTFVTADDVLDPLGELAPGRDGGLFGLEFGRPINAAWDWRVGLNAAFFADDTARSVEPLITSNAESSFDYQYLDLELGYRPGFVPGHGLRVFAGPRVLRAANDIDYDTNGINKVGTYERDVELWAAGGRAGAEAALPLGNSGFSLTALGAGSALYARSQADFTFDFTGSNNGNGSDRLRDDRVIYNLEARAALNYAATDRIDFQVGYQVQQWWDLTTTFGTVESADTTIDNVGTGDVLVHGPFARVTIKLGGPKQP